MKRKIGLWIDHRKAVVVTVTGRDVKQSLVISNLERHLCRSGDRPLKGPYQVEQVPAQDRQKRAYQAHLNTYYDTVITGIRDAASVLILGPGPAKTELIKRLQRNGLKGSGVVLETTDKMTDRQIVAKVRNHFKVTD